MKYDSHNTHTTNFSIIGSFVQQQPEISLEILYIRTVQLYIDNFCADSLILFFSWKCRFTYRW